MKYDHGDRAFYNAVFDVLVSEAGASDNILTRSVFVDDFCRAEYPATEFRFMGSLGFGGKFWRANGSFYVSCYPESVTEARSATINTVNKLIADLVILHSPKVMW